MNDAPEMHARPKIVGARIKRTEDPRLLTGLGAYTDDRQVMRVLHVAFRRSDQAHARIRSIDCSAARAAPGVVAVLTAEDLSAAVQPLVATSRMPNYYPTPLLPLAQHKVRYVGEPVVGVIAQSRYHAEDALDSLRAEQKEARAAGRWVGIGIACYAELTGIGSRISVAPGMPINTGTETAIVRIDSTGAVTAAFGVAAHGQGLETTLAQIVAEHLGARFDDIRVVQGDSSAVPGGTGTYASRSMVLAGGAGTLAAQAVREKVLNAASHLLEASVADLVAEDGRVTVVGTDRSISFREVARAVYSELARLPAEARGELAATRTYDPVFGTTSAATHIATVEIDPETYEIRVERFVVAEDCGRLVNPLIVDGQVHGGVAQGIGAALYEEVIYDERGQVTTGSLVDYLVPSACEIPPMLVVHLESESPTTLGGFRGMGEGGTIGAPAAVANAVADALAPLGIEINELPATPERLFRLIEAARARRKP
jgi:carbon-monoxide dehydrogenase large subunit